MYEKIVGFLILKRPEFMNIVAPYNKLSEIGKKRYSGFERSHLYDLSTQHINKSLPADISSIIDKSLDECRDFIGLGFIRDFQDAKKAFDFNSLNSQDELVVISSEKIMELKGFSEIDSQDIEWLGYDIFLFGNGSLISAGLFFKSYLFKNWIERINEYGLFDTPEYAQDYFKDYQSAARLGEVEDYGVFENEIDTIRIGKIITST